MTKKQFDYWLKQLGRAWVEKNPQLIADICAQNVKYHETPFTKPYTSPAAVKKLWQEVPDLQKDIKFKYEILVVSKKFGIAQWQAEFTRIKQNKKAILDGIFLVELNRQGLCTLFKMWWVVK